MTQIIGISGHARGGKDSLARYFKALCVNDYLLYSANIFTKSDLVFFEKLQSYAKRKELFEHIISSHDEDKIHWGNFYDVLNKSNMNFYKNITQTIQDNISANTCKIYSFAKPIKTICVEVLGLTEAQVNGTDADKNTLTKYKWENIPKDIREKYNNPSGFMTAREVMQIFGTDIMRDYFSDSIWVDTVLSKIKKDSPEIAVITDVRFASEVDSLINIEAKIIRLSRRINKKSTHQAEVQLLSYDWSKVPSKDFIYIDNEHMSMQEKNLYSKEFFLNILKKD